MLSITKSTSTLLRLFLCVTYVKYSVSRCPTPSHPRRRILSVSKELKTEVVLQIQGVMKSTVTGELKKPKQTKTQTEKLFAQSYRAKAVAKLEVKPRCPNSQDIF